jgi:ADP-ribosylglycohydrolase
MNEKGLGCLFGSAFGDAFGAPTEFMSVSAILRKWSPDGPTDLEGNPIRVTDDTQMMIAVGFALIACKDDLSPDSLERELRRTFVEWLDSPDNNRAPGMTCLEACRRLQQNLPWLEATHLHSKGCGANMRVAPVGLLNKDEKTRSAIAQFQSAITHGHPTALAASDLTAYAVTLLIDGCEPSKLLSEMRRYAKMQKLVYHKDWLGDLWKQTNMSSPEEFISRGWTECLDALEKIDIALFSRNYDADPCLSTGEGWIAEEALATALLCFLLYPNNPEKVLQRAAVTSGDSDSIASLAGAFAGATHGISVWNERWIAEIEYKDKLETIVEALAGSADGSSAH